MQTSFPFRPFSPAFTNTGARSYSSHCSRYSDSYPNTHPWPTGGHQPRSNETIPSLYDFSRQSHGSFRPVLSDDSTSDFYSMPNMDGFPRTVSARCIPDEPDQPGQPSRGSFISDLGSLSENSLWRTSNLPTPSRSYHARPRWARFGRSHSGLDARFPWYFRTAYLHDLSRRERRGFRVAEYNEPFSVNYVHSTPARSRRGSESSVHCGRTQFLNNPEYHYDREGRQEPCYPSFRDDHDTDRRYDMSGAIDPRDYDVFNILNPEHNQDLHQNLGFSTGRSPPEIMVDRAEYGIGNDYAHVDRDVDPFAFVDPFRSERGTAGISDPQDPITRRNLHGEHEGLYHGLSNNRRNRRRHAQRPEQHHKLFDGPAYQSFPHTESYHYEQTQIRSGSAFQFSTSGSNFNSAAAPPPDFPDNSHPYDHFHSFHHMQHSSLELPIQNSDHQRHEIMDLLAELRRLHASLSRKHLRFRYATACLDHEISKIRSERACLRFERKRYRRWHQRMKEYCLENETCRQGAREEQGGRKWYRTSNKTNTWWDDRANDRSSSQISEPQTSQPHPPPGTPQESSPRPVPQSASRQTWFLPSLVNMQLLLDIYDKAWDAVKTTGPSSSLPWPSHDLSGPTLDQQDSCLNRPLDTTMDLSKVREWRVFSFFVQAYGFVLDSTDTEIPIPTIIDSLRIRCQIYGYPDLIGLKKRLKVEATRWHPDKLGNRKMSLEDKERAKSVFHGIVWAKSLVDMSEEDERRAKRCSNGEEDL